MSQMYERTRDEVRESWIYRAAVALMWWAVSRAVHRKGKP